MILFKNLIQDLSQYLIDDNNNLLSKIRNFKVTNITNHSKKVQTKGIFFVINKKSLDYLEEVFSHNPLAVVIDISLKKDHIVQEGLGHGKKIIFSHDIDIRKLYSLFVTKFHNLKNLPLKIVAITGTNGKSSSTFFYKQLCNFAGLRACSIGTIGIYSDDERDIYRSAMERASCPAEPSVATRGQAIKESMKFNRELITVTYKENSLTTPDISDLCEIIKEKAENGIFDIAVEASSHGLDQYRLDGVPLEVVGFTNFTQDHLDYHNTIEKYWEAKKRLFSELIRRDKKIVINNDDPKSWQIKEICCGRGIQYITVGIKNESDIQILNYNLTDDYEYEIELNICDKKYSFSASVLGEFQLYNMLVAIGCFYCVHPELTELLFFQDGGGKLEDLKAPPGRMEPIYLNNGSIAIIDYAHSPDGLENLLISSKRLLKEHEKLLLVFGCGGNRDKQKRPIMGGIAEKYSDFIILTDDNPRNEEPDKIRDEIITGIEDKNQFIQIGNRREAIEKAISLKEEYKIILIAGKGHEKKQIIGSEIIEFDDKELVDSLNSM